MAIAVAGAGGTGACRAFEELAKAAGGIAFAAGTRQSVVAEVGDISAESIDARGGVTGIIAGAIRCNVTGFLAPGDGDVLAAQFGLAEVLSAGQVVIARPGEV